MANYNIKKLSIRFMEILTYLIYPFYLLKKRYIKRIITIIHSTLVKIEIKNNGQKVGINFRIGRSGDIKINKSSKVSIGNNVILNDDIFINVRENAVLIIGNNVHIGKGVRISSFESIVIGDNTLIASYCNLLDHNHSFNLKEPTSSNSYECSSIYIGKGVWLGTKVQVNKGIKIGDFSVIGANSVVTKDVLKSSVYAGIPAKKIR